MELRFQSDIVTPWGLFAAGIGEFLRIEVPELDGIRINQLAGDLPTVSAVADSEADVGITTPPACATMGYRGVGPFTEKMDNLRAIGSFPHDDRMLWAVPAESGINSIEEMPQKPLRLVLPGKNYPVRFAVERILESYGTPLSYLESRGWSVIEDGRCLAIPDNVLYGRADALVHEAKMTPAWKRLTESRQMRFLPIRDDILSKMESEYGFRKAILSKGMLKGVERDIPCIDFSEWLMFVRDDMPDNIAYAITKIFVEEQRKLFGYFLRDLPAEGIGQAWKNVGSIPFHSAAEQYYKEHGYL